MTFTCKPGQYAEIDLNLPGPAFDFRKLGINAVLEAEYNGFLMADRLLEEIRAKARAMALELLYEGRLPAVVGMPDGIPIIGIIYFGSILNICLNFPSLTPDEIKWNWEDAFRGPSERINLGDFIL